MSFETAVLGASGYVGAELLRLLAGHPDFDVTVVTASTQAGRDVGQLYPHLAEYADLALVDLEDAADDVAKCPLVFCGLPHGEAMKVLPGLDNELVVDASADFRLDDPSEYERWYGAAHTAPDQLDRWVYGLPELFREDISEADRVASPGCYPTAVVLAVAPLVSAGLVGGTIVADCYSGTSGAGRSPKPNLHFAHVFEDARAYSVAGHRHVAEMEMALSSLSDRDVTVSFTPHLAPMVRGIHATCSAEAAPGATAETVRQAFADLYDDEDFVAVAAAPPGTKEVRGSNAVLVHPVLDERCNRVIVTCVIDNLVKGAAGQAIQNANLALGIDEATGLPLEGLYP
ncbi:MAG: N-acetyl-gamma-glutamyl-phosphate reductase [Acidimicrobiia bacterium]|nr:N-acetyl-gamma-glutamyl-phosphate reductase [Acidimicrobiia bacterium]